MCYQVLRRLFRAVAWRSTLFLFMHACSQYIDELAILRCLVVVLVARLRHDGLIRRVEPARHQDHRRRVRSCVHIRLVPSLMLLLCLLCVELWARGLCRLLRQIYLV